MSGCLGAPVRGALTRLTIGRPENEANPMRKLLILSAAAVVLAGPSLAWAQAPSSSTAPRPAALAKVDTSALSATHRASKVRGSTVINERNENIGKIDDLLIAREGAKEFAVLSVGGFLGMGNHLVAVPFDSLSFTADNKIMLRGATKDELKALPEFKYTSTASAAPANRATTPSSSTAPRTTTPSTTR
jgi:hypothetical protein